MPSDLEKVQSGDLIEASLYNDLVDRIRSLESRIEGTPGNLVTVPRFVGDRLGSSIDVIQQPNVSLDLGLVHDSFGYLVTPTGADTRARIVVGQMPRPNAEVAPGTTVYLLIAAEATDNGGDGGPPPIPQPTIDSINPSSQNIGSPIQITGSNFSTDADEVSVIIDGVEVGEIRGLDANSMEVTVPSSITNPADNGNASRDVTVEVTVLGKTATYDGFTVKPPPDTPDPVIDKVDTTRHYDDDRSQGQARVGEKVVVIGDHFVEDQDKMSVKFLISGASDKDATIEEIRIDQGGDKIDIIIPDLNPPDTGAVYDLKVSRGEAESKIFESGQNPGGTFKIYAEQ